MLSLLSPRGSVRNVVDATRTTWAENPARLEWSGSPTLNMNLNLRVISLVLIVVGVIVEFATSGSQIGNLIAGVGIAGYVYDFFKRRQRPPL